MNDVKNSCFINCDNGDLLSTNWSCFWTTVHSKPIIPPPPKSFALLAPQGDLYAKVHHYYRSRSSDGNSAHVRAIKFHSAHIKTKFGPNHCNMIKATQSKETKKCKNYLTFQKSDILIWLCRFKIKQNENDMSKLWSQIPEFHLFHVTVYSNWLSGLPGKQMLLKEIK